MACTSPATDAGTAGAPPAPLIFAIQHFCIHDGPGTRSVVFFKGCPLRCQWCQNPESWRRETELAHKGHLCIDCETCVDVCPTGALTEPGVWDTARCDLCLRCVDACPAAAMVRFGEPHTADDVLAALIPEFNLYRRSSGGVTLSGGEATLFVPLATEIAQRLRNRTIHVTLETCGLFKHAAVEPLLATIDLVLFDLKLFDDNAHRAQCGAGNVGVKENLRGLVARAASGEGPRIWPRLPIIPGITSVAENVAGWASLLQEIGVRGVTLVPYHQFGAGKRSWLPDAPAAPDLGVLSPAELERCAAILAAHGVQSFAPGSEDWRLLDR